MNFDIDASKGRPIPLGLTDKSKWDRYPQGLFGNWTQDQVNRSQMLTKCSDHGSSTIYKVGVFVDGNFDKQMEARAVRQDDVANLRAYWNDIGMSVSSMHVGCLEAEVGCDSHLRISEYRHFSLRT